MNKAVLLVAVICGTPAFAGFDEKVAASFSAKYEVCSIRLQDRNGYRNKARRMKAEARRIHLEKLGGGGYMKALEREKRQAWAMPLHRCKTLAERF